MRTANSTNKPLDREQYNSVMPTTLKSGGALWLVDNKVVAGEYEGYIKRTFEDSVHIVSEVEQDLSHIVTASGDPDYVGEIAIVVNLDNEFEFRKATSISQTMDPSQVLQMYSGFFDKGNVYDIEPNLNCVLGTDTASDFKYFAEAHGRISNIKIRPSTQSPLAIETYQEENEVLSRFVYGGDKERSFKENIELRRKTSSKKFNTHKPEVEIGKVDRYSVRPQGSTDIVDERVVTGGEVIIKAFKPNDLNTPTKKMKEGTWGAVAIDMREINEGVTTQDSSFLFIYDRRVFNSKSEAYFARTLTESESEHARIGWVFFRSDCVDLSDETRAIVVSTDRFNTQAYNPPLIRDAERAEDLAEHLSLEYIFNNTGQAVMNLEGHALRN